MTPECVERFYDVISSPDFGGPYHIGPDTAIGSNPVSPMGHLLMMAAVQPYLSGAISKTVNLPATATVEDIKQVYQSAWSLGLKCVAVFRDGCKGWQPMEAIHQHIDTNAGDSIQLLDDGMFYATPKAIDALMSFNARVQAVSMSGSALPVDDVHSYYPVATDPRRRMPDTRASVTHKFQLGGVEGYLHIGEYPDGTPGELFVHVNKEGSTVGGLMDAWAICFSMALQYGVPLRKLVDKFRGVKFDPAGFTPNADVPSATSLVDYVVRWMEIRYLFPGELAKAETPRNSGPLRTSYYSGDACPECGHLMVQTGTCKSCPECGHGGGCG
jgi:ribonucleoside-diphosphate reductase alpha chain